VKSIRQYVRRRTGVQQDNPVVKRTHRAMPAFRRSTLLSMGTRRAKRQQEKEQLFHSAVN